MSVSINFEDVHICEKCRQPVYIGPSYPYIADIQRIVADEFSISINELKSPRRDQYVVVPRHAAIYMCHIYTTRTSVEIGRHFGNRDHSTILQSIKSIKLKINNSTGLRTKMMRIEKEIKNLIIRIIDEKARRLVTL